ncbi:MAG TPA: hypothetical protein VGF56_00370 [Rhizomicrobium sp.]
MRFGAIFPIVFIALATPALADPPPHPSEVQAGTLHGDYYFYATGPKVCAERWRFADDGTMTVFSGDEILTQHFRVEQRETYSTFTKTNISQSWLITTGPVSNGKPDCLGNAAVTYKAQDAIVLYRAVDGGIVTCWPHVAFAPEPFGHVYPAADADAAIPPPPRAP